MEKLPGADDLPAALAAQLAVAVAREAPAALRTRHRNVDGRPRYTNRLALQPSPYLRQHAHNPVNWYPWGDEAFAEARRRGCPVFLSIGYSTCHWCHVMEEESFEDEQIAALLNASHVAIKVDREERPDVDALYMKAAQALTGGGGWPLSVWLTPEREPFFAGTYFPPRAGVRGAGSGFVDVVAGIARLFHDEPERVRDSARALTAVVRTTVPEASGEGGVAEANLDWIARAVETCRHSFDERFGGLRAQQKFPSHLPVRLLLRHQQRTGDARALDMAVRTLEAMASGGIYDHVAGAFHRYATDPAWRVPHFEKMLYDNALLVHAYTEAWQVTRRPLFARVVSETCDELLATFAAPHGGFYSATDADSEGEEGKYFVWTPAQIREVLGSGDECERFLDYYGMRGPDQDAEVLGVPRPDEARALALTAARARLADARRRRVPPLRDEKILAAWNGLAIGAFAVAGRVLDRPRYVVAARRAADFVLGRMRDGDGRLVRSQCDGRAGGSGFLDDHAFVAAGLLDLFEATQEARWLSEAIRLCEIVEADFADPDGGWFMVGQDHQGLLARERSLFDGAEPAGGSVALMNAARLGVYTDDARWHRVAARSLARVSPLLERQPLAATEALLAVDFLAGPVRELVVALPGGQEDPFARVVRESFCPRKALVIGQPGSAAWDAVAAIVPFARDKSLQDGRATAYLCTRGRCELPTTDAARLAEQLSG